MKARPAARLVLLGALLICGVPNSFAVPVDGTLDPSYGPPLSTQTTQTSLYDGSQCVSQPDQVTFSTGSELDAAYAYTEGGVLHLFFAGNMASCYFGEITYIQHYLEIFIDSKPGGQNPLRSDNSSVGYRPNALNRIAGLTFDSDFTPDYWLDCTVWWEVPPLYAYFSELDPGGGGPGYFLGQAAAGGPGTLSGGTNPDGIQVSINDSNVGGVTAGCGAASGAGVTTGIEWAIPLSAIGNPSGCIKVCALLDCGDWCSTPFTLSNQVLGPVPLGTCDLGEPALVDLGAISGNQYFSVCDGPTPTRPTTWGSLKAIYR